MANQLKREILTDVKRELVDSARTKLQAKIDRLNESGWHNQFDYANYGVQYNPIYDKKTGRVKTFQESGLTSTHYTHLARMMGSSPELTDKWNEDRARKIAGDIFDTLSKRDIVAFAKHTYANREAFIEKYVEAVKKYHQDDEDFNYEVIKSIFGLTGGQSVPGFSEEGRANSGASWANNISSLNV